MTRRREGRHIALHDAAADLYKELCSCALDAELARLTGSWDLRLRAEHAGQRMPERVDNSPVSKKFRHIRKGGRFKPNHAVRLAEAYRSVRLLPCQEHRLAQVLCNPRLSRDKLMDWLLSLPHGRVRRTLIEDTLTLLTAFRRASRRRWEPRSIHQLVEIGSAASLFALVCRSRIAQLEGEDHLGELEEAAIWMTVPKAAGRSMSLLLGSHALVRAIDFFLGWEPFAELRIDLSGMSVADDLRDEALIKLQSLREKAIRSGRIPESEFERRANQASLVEIPTCQKGALG